MKKIFIFITFIIFSTAVFSQITGKRKGFPLAFTVNAKMSMDSMEAVLLASFMDSSITEFSSCLLADTLLLDKKFNLNKGTYLFLSLYDDRNSLQAPYESSFVVYRFSKISQWMIFLMEIKENEQQDEFNLEYGDDKLKFY